MALHHRAKEVVWLRRLLEEIVVCQKEPTVIFCDNESAVKLAKNACLHRLTKQIRPKWHWVRRILDKEVRLEIVKTHQQAADILTKCLAESEHWKGMNLAGMSTPSLVYNRREWWAVVAVVEAAVGVAAVEAVRQVAVRLALGVSFLGVASVSSSSVGARPRLPSSFTCGWLHTQHCCFSHLDDAWRAEFGDNVDLPRWADLLKSRIAIFDLDFDAILSAIRYAAHYLNLWPRVSLPETLPILRWTGEVGDASMFRVWGNRAFVRDTSADKLSPRAIPCVFLGFLPDAPGWQFYHPTSRRVFPSKDITFDEPVPFYRLFPYRSAPPPPPPLFLAPGPPLVDPLPPQGPAPPPPPPRLAIPFSAIFPWPSSLHYRNLPFCAALHPTILTVGPRSPSFGSFCVPYRAPLSNRRLHSACFRAKGVWAL
ncbi:unnamed protein product [Closterium sp. NIES-53]